MDKIDARIVNQLKVSSKVSSALVKTLENEDERADAIVRVRNPLHLGFLERSFDVVASYPFIRSIGIKCGLEDAIRLERMSEEREKTKAIMKSIVKQTMKSLTIAATMRKFCAE